MKRALLLLAAVQAALAAEGAQQFVSLGDFKLESGAEIRDCRIGYRTYGQLNRDKTNAILFPTWFTGTSKDLEQYFGAGPAKMIDTSSYFVIAADALANGVSSSPSNSAAQPRLKFPKVSIRDMVNTQRRLVTEVFGIKQLHAVAGISMGGMQAFEWAVSYPKAMERAIPIVGTPRLASTDLLLWTAEMRAIQEHRDYRGGNYDRPPDLQALSLIHAYALTTPRYRAERTSRDQFPAYLKEALGRNAGFDANDRIRQLEAMLAHDVAAPYNGSLARAAIEVRAAMLIIVAGRDHMVNSAPAIEFSKLIRTPAIVLEGDCGHLIFDCQSDGVVPKVTEFLRRGEPRKPLFDSLLK
ncbi:MAG: alpha/beta fold hydrolase [Acidobacteria bacterium]|nr:alpha/beta fold hydrolase [Acidobacteriota bacterium]